MAELWERQHRETIRAYAAFCAYRDLGPDRSLEKVKQTLDKTRSTKWLGYWSSKHNWVARAQAYDDYLDRKKREEAEKAILEMQRRHIEELEALQNKAISRLAEMDISELGARDVLNYIVEAIKLERLARGLTTEKVEHQGEMTQVVKNDDAASAILGRLRAAVAAANAGPDSEVRRKRGRKAGQDRGGEGQS